MWVQAKFDRSGRSKIDQTARLAAQPDFDQSCPLPRPPRIDPITFYFLKYIQSRKLSIKEKRTNIRGSKQHTLGRLHAIHP